MSFQNALKIAMQEMKSAHSQFDYANQDLYAEWIAQTYFFVSHTAKFIALSLALAQDKKAERQALQHLREEAGHDLLLLKDLKSISRDLSEFEELPATKAFWQTQYYWISYVHPASHLGYALFLESMAVECGQTVFGRIQRAHGVANGFLKLHHEEDQEHSSRGIEIVESLPPELQVKIIENLKESHFLYQEILTSCQAKHLKQPKLLKKAS